MTAGVFAKMMAWIVKFINDIKALFDELKETLSKALEK